MLTDQGSQLGKGGSGSGDVIPRVLKELAGLTIGLHAGAAPNTKIDVPAIRTEDTILSVINNATGGVLSDITGTCSIVGTTASGILTAAAVADGDSCVVHGVTYTFKTAPVASGQIKIGLNDNANAAALAAAINSHESRYDGSIAAVPAVKASASNAVVTVTAVADGAAGNAPTLTGTAVRLAASGAGTLAGGTDTGGIQSTGATDQVIIHWYNKQ